jgi:WD40 repeat protein
MDEVKPLVPDHVLVRPIGKGGFGRVWLARNVLGTYRAVKVVSRIALEREHDFQREINGIQRFEPVSRRHEGLVDVLQIGRAPDESYFYYVMELGDDVEPRQEFEPEQYKPRTLAAELRRRSRIPATEAALIGAQLADALAFLHSQGLIHRDIKPSNTLFVRGQVRIGDPGLVAMIEASQSLGGTLGYMAPEGPGTPQADIYGLGKLLYVIATGKDAGEFPILPADMTSYEDVGDLRRLNHIVLRACAYNPKDRYASAVELRKDLLEVHAGGSPGETRRRLKIARRIGIGLAILLVLIMAGYYRASVQDKAERARISKGYMEAAVGRQDANDPLEALPYLGAMPALDPGDKLQNESVARRISFIWRYSPRLVGQWYFTNAINRVAFDSKGRGLAIASSAGEVWLWRWRRQESPFRIGRHGEKGSPAEVEGVTFSPDGQWLASVGADKTVRLWPLSDAGETTRTIRLQQKAHAVAFHPTENRLAIACGDSVFLSDFDGRETRCLFKTTNTVNCVAFSPNGEVVMAGDRNGYVYEREPKPGYAVRTNKLSWVYDLSFNREGTLLAAAAGFRARLDPIADQPMARIRHPALVRSVCFDQSRPAGADRLLTSCLDNTVRLWSCAEDEEIMPPIHTEREPTCATFGPDGTTFAVSTVGGLVRVYCLPSNVDDIGLARTAVSSDGSRFARVEQETNVLVFQSSSGRVERRISVAGPRIEQIDLDRSGTRLLVRQHLDQKLAHFEVWKVNDDGPFAMTNVQCSVKLASSLSPDGNCVALRTTNNLILWQPMQGTSFARPWTLVEPVGEAELRFSYRSPRLVVVWSTNVLVLSTTNAEQIASWSLRYHAQTADIDAAGDFVVVGESPPGFIASTNYVWNVRTRERASPPLIMEDGSFVARFDPSGRSLIVSDQKGNLTLYDTVRKKTLPLRQRSGMITDAAFSLDGRFVATSTEDRGGKIPNIQVWEVSSGEPVTPLLRVSLSAFGRVRFLAGDNALLWFTGKGNWHRWDLERLAAPASKLADLAHLLSCQQITATGESVSLPGSTLDRLWRELSEEHPDWFSVPSR